MKALIGFAMMVVLFMALFLFGVISLGWLQTVLVFLLAAILLLWVKIAVDLLV